MDFMYDLLEDCRTFRLFNLIDNYNREAIYIEADFSLPAERVIRELKQMISWREKPQVIRCYKGSEYISAPIQIWAAEWGISLNIFSLKTNSKKYTLKDSTEQFATNDRHNVTGPA